MGIAMIGAVSAWLRRRWWALEDALTDVIDWQPRAEPPIKPLPPAPPSEPQHYVPFSAVGVNFQRISAEQANDEMLQQIVKALGRGQLIEIRY